MALDLSRMTFLLVVEDSPMQRLIRDLLADLGAGRVVEAANGTDGLVAVAENEVDIVISDWMTEPMDGLDFVRRLRACGGGGDPTVPIIMLTGHTERHRIVEARDAGVTEFLAKPATARGVSSRIRSIVEAPRPFVRLGRYAGPDRRRRAANEDDRRRRALDADAAD
ncbi:MAG: response regulator [Marivibrio sp.]|uniref:response regulator n=1 Tax=Marivibrio sp. TaxID=2039719 RepID=UPI0032EF0C35